MKKVLRKSGKFCVDEGIKKFFPKTSRMGPATPARWELTKPLAGKRVQRTALIITNS